MTRALSTVAIGVLVVSAIGLGLGSPANAEEDSDLAALNEAAPEIISEALEPSADDDGDLSFDVDGAVIEVPEAPKEGVAVVDGRETRTVLLPVAADSTAASERDGVKIYDNADETLSAVAVNESRVSFLTIVESPAAPTEFDYSYEQYGDLRQSQDDGAVTIWDGDAQIGFLFEPWAYDANGTAVPTRYEVVGNILTQVVDHRSGAYAYPIVADPTQTFPGSNALYSRIIEDRNASTGEVIIRVTPNPSHSAAWHRVPRSTVISNYNSVVPSTYERQNLWDQLACHAYNVPFNKGTWNLETWRPNVGYNATVLAACNPS